MAEPRFLSSLARHGSAPALLARDGGVLSFTELDARVAELAARLAGPRGLVAIEAEVSQQAVIGLLASWRAGHAAVMLAPDAALWDDFGARFRPDASWRPAGSRWRLTRDAARGGAEPHPELALLLATSGSTGRARMVRLSATAVDANARAIGGYLGLGPDDRAGLVLPLSYSYGLSVLTSHLAAGASVWLHGGSILDPDFLIGLAARGCASFAGVPYSYDLLERIGFREAELPDLRCMTVAGGRLAPERVRLYDAHLRARGGRFFAMYGQTEATARIAYLPPERAAEKPDRIGRAIPGGALALIDDRGREITGAGVVGELVYRGPNVMMGYADARPDLVRGAELDRLATGDLAEQDAEGLYRIVGRLKRISKIGGARVSLDGLEARLAAEGITVAVAGDDEELVAAYEGQAAAESVRARLAALAAVPGTRVRVTPVERLPRLASGKPDYVAVRAAAATPAQSSTRAPDRRIETDFREVFLPRPVGPDDSFASLGGDSLRRVELAMMLERRLGALPEGWEEMPLARLARLEARREAPAMARIDSDLVARVLAILAVVAHHATDWPIPVGSAVMVVLIGHGLARYQARVLAADGIAGFLAPLPLVLAPYFLILAGYALAWGQVPWASVFLVGNLGFADPVDRTMLPYLYWFVEVYAQILLILAAVFLIPPARRAAIERPFGFGLGLLAAALALRAVGPDLWPLAGRQIFTVAWVGPLAALGWCVAAARGRERFVVLALAAGITPVLAWDGGNWLGAWVRYGGVFAVIALLGFVPTLPVPARALPVLLTLAAASYPIYLTHLFAPNLILAPLAAVLSAPVFAAASIVGGVLLGLAVAQGWRLVTRRSRAGLAAIVERA